MKVLVQLYGCIAQGPPDSRSCWASQSASCVCLLCLPLPLTPPQNTCLLVVRCKVSSPIEKCLEVWVYISEHALIHFAAPVVDFRRPSVPLLGSCGASKQNGNLNATPLHCEVARRALVANRQGLDLEIRFIRADEIRILHGTQQNLKHGIPGNVTGETFVIVLTGVCMHIAKSCDFEQPK